VAGKKIGPKGGARFFCRHRGWGGAQGGTTPGMSGAHRGARGAGQGAKTLSVGRPASYSAPFDFFFSNIFQMNS
jgi:hypothetical protein